MKWNIMKDTNFSNWKIHFSDHFIEWNHCPFYPENLMVAFCFKMALGPLFKGLTLQSKRLTLNKNTNLSAIHKRKSFVYVDLRPKLKFHSRRRHIAHWQNLSRWLSHDHWLADPPVPQSYGPSVQTQSRGKHSFFLWSSLPLKLSCHWTRKFFFSIISPCLTLIHIF